MYAWSTLFLASAFMLTIIYWLVYPYKTLEIKTQPMKVLTPEVKAHDMFYYEVDYCKYINKPAQVTRTLIDTVIYNMPSFTANNDMGCHTRAAMIEIPNVPAGTYVYRVKFDYQVNPIRHILIVAETEPFNIVEEKKEEVKPIILNPTIKNTIIVPTLAPLPTPKPTPTSLPKGGRK